MFAALTAAAGGRRIVTMPGVTDHYAPCLASPTCLEDFDTALRAVSADRLADRISDVEAVAAEDAIRRLREEYIMRDGG